MAPVVWNLFRLLVWALVLIVLSPNVLSLVGWDEAGRWLRTHPWARWLALPVLGPLFLLSAFELRSVRRVRPGEPDAPEADLDDPEGGLDATLGLREGETLRWPFEGHVIEAATWSARGDRRLVARARLRASSSFGFAARSARLEPAWMRGLAQKAIRAGLDRARKSADHSDPARFEAVEFLAQDPLDLTGTPLTGKVVLRSNAPGRARELFSDSEIVRVVTELERDGRKWELTLYPSEEPGVARLSFECPGRTENPGLAESARALVSAILRRLEAEPLADGSRSARLPRDAA